MRFSLGTMWWTGLEWANMLLSRYLQSQQPMVFAVLELGRMKFRLPISCCVQWDYGY